MALMDQEPPASRPAPASPDKAFILTLVSAVGLGSALFSCCFAIVPLVGIVPAAGLFLIGLLLSLSALLTSRLKYKTWEPLALAGLCFCLISVLLAVSANLLFFWGMELLAEGMVRILEWFTSPLQDYPGF